METNAFTFLKEYKPLVSNKDVVYFSFFFKKKKRLLEPLFSGQLLLHHNLDCIAADMLRV